MKHRFGKHDDEQRERPDDRVQQLELARVHAIISMVATAGAFRPVSWRSQRSSPTSLARSDSRHNIEQLRMTTPIEGVRPTHELHTARPLQEKLAMRSCLHAPHTTRTNPVRPPDSGPLRDRLRKKTISPRATAALRRATAASTRIPRAPSSPTNAPATAVIPAPATTSATCTRPRTVSPGTSTKRWGCFSEHVTAIVTSRARSAARRLCRVSPSSARHRP